jgi:hypothetical protein
MASPYLVVAFVVGGIAVAILAAASVDGSVCGNKINTPLHLADPPSFIPAAAPPRRHWDMLRFDPKSSPATTPNQQPINSMHPSSVENLQIWCRFDSFAILWDPGVSFFYLRRQVQQHPSLAGVRCPCKLTSPSFNRRFARSVHPGVHVSDTPATLRRRHRQLQLRRLYSSLLLKDFVVIWFSFEDLDVTWLLF